MFTKKNQGNVPECKDERLRYVPTKCGKCIECRKEKARNWRIRLAEELKNNPDALFITLTFNEDNYQKLAWELFKKNKENLNYTEQNEMCKTAIIFFVFSDSALLSDALQAGHPTARNVM